MDSIINLHILKKDLFSEAAKIGQDMHTKHRFISFLKSKCFTRIKKLLRIKNTVKFGPDGLQN